MITYTSNDNKKIYKLHYKDVAVLILISLGWQSCTELSKIIGLTKPTINDKINKLEQAGLVSSKDNYGEKHYYKIYVVTKKGFKKLESLNPLVV